MGFSRYALNFDGINDYVEVNHAASLSNFNDISISAWLYMRALGTWPRWTAKGTFGVTEEWYLITDATFDIMKFCIVSGGAEKGSGDWLSPPLNIWMHVVGTFDGNEVALWINGTKVKSAPFVGVRDYSTEPICLGVEAGTASFASGLIDEVCIYNRALSAREIQYNMLNYHNLGRSGLVLQLRMEEGAGLIVTDTSGYGNNGNLLPGVSPPTWRRNQQGELRAEAGL